MGFFKDILNSTIGDSISKSISKAMNSSSGDDSVSVNEIGTDAASEDKGSVNGASEAVVNFDTACDLNSDAVFNTVLANYPRWNYSAVENVSTSDEGDYIQVLLTMRLDDDIIEKYQKALKENGFTGDWQIMKKNIGGKEHYVDFSFVQDGNINYLIYK